MKRASKVKENSPQCWRLPALAGDGHKYARGHVALLGGETMTGAAKLAALAAQRAGAGVVTLAASERTWPIYAISMMSVITRPISGIKDWRWILNNRKVTCVSLGPGAQPDALLEKAIHAALDLKLPLLLDAGALELLSESKSLCKAIRNRDVILTPHEGEYKRLAQLLSLDPKAPKPQRALALAKATGAVVLLKGAETIIASPKGKLLVNRARAPWLATAGSGDVLAGIIAGLRAQGMGAFDAAAAGAWLHAQAARTFGPGMIAEDLLDVIPQILAKTS